MKKRLKIAVTGGETFLRQYIIHEYVAEENALTVDNVTEADIVVHAPRTDALGETRRLNLHPDQTIVVIGSEEEGVDQWAALLSDRGLNVTTIVTGWIVGTGMDGAPRMIVNAIARGNYMHIEGTAARHSVIHAADVATYARLLAGRGGRWEVADGPAPTVDELTEALAWRISHKRIFSLTARQWKLLSWVPWLGCNRESWRSTDCILYPAKTIEAAGKPSINVIERLRNHEYGNDDI